jgi:hypothetical protein
MGHLHGMVELRPSWKRKTAGFGLMGLGVIGLILPFLNGIIPMALGVFMLRHQYVWAHRALGPLQRRWPAAMTRVEGMEDRTLAWGRRQASRLPFIRARS